MGEEFNAFIFTKNFITYSQTLKHIE